MEDMSAVAATIFDRNYELHLKHLKLKGLQPKTIEAYSRAIRRVGDYFDHQIDDLSEADLVGYFTDLRETHSWSSVKLDLYGLKFCHEYVLTKPWVAPGLIKPPRSQRLPDIVTIEEAERIFGATRVLSYRVCLLLHALQSRPAPWRRVAADRCRHRRCTRACAYPRCQGQQGSPGAAADGHLPTPAPVLATPPQSRAVVSQSPRRLGRRTGSPNTARSRRRSEALRSVVESCGTKRTFRPTACVMPMPRT